MDQTQLAKNGTEGFQGDQLETVFVSCVVTEKKLNDDRRKILPEDMMVLIAIPTPRPDRAKRGSSTSSMYL